MKNKINFVFAIFLVLAVTGIVSAAGIASPYWKDHPLTMNYGETKVVNFNLQNLVGDEDVTVEVILKKGGEIASLGQTRFTAPAGTSDTYIPLAISIPEDYRGGIQIIELEVKTVEEGLEGTVTLGTGWISSFNVIVGEESVSKSSLTTIIILLIIAILILSVIVYFYARRK